MTTRFIRAQLAKLKDRTEDEPISTERKAQELVGMVLQRIHHAEINYQETEFKDFKAVMALPEKTDRSGAVLYLHGGGYCCGDLEYAKGFGTALSAQANVSVFCPAYRLAPEFPFPAALDDAITAYRFMLDFYEPAKIVITGESAGGGLIYCLCQRLRNEGLPLPGGLVTMSPWADLTACGASYKSNEEADPSMLLSHLQRFVVCYSDTPSDPLVSPVFGDLHGLPESLIFVGGDEIMRDDAAMLHSKLLAEGCKSTLTVAPGLWHAYIIYGLKERKQDMDDICAFIRKITL